MGIVPEVTSHVWHQERHRAMPSQTLPRAQTGLAGRITNLSEKDPKSGGRVVMVMVVMVMVMHRGEGRSGENHDQEHSSKQLFHGLNITQCELQLDMLRPRGSCVEAILSCHAESPREA